MTEGETPSSLEPPTLESPSDLTLPFVAYGVLRRGELAFAQLAPFVLANEEVRVPGSLFVRDGLPLLKLADGPAHNAVRADLLSFHPESAERAYQAICQLEPPKQYRWQTIELPSGLSANVLVGIRPEAGSSQWEEEEWSSSSDPVFEFAVPLIRSITDEVAATPFDSAPPQSFDWIRFFRLQMAYLLLWSAIERFTSLAYGSALDPMKRVGCLARDPRFTDLSHLFGTRRASVVDSRDPRKKESLDASKPYGSLKYYYQVRSNLSHRGKGAFDDGETVRQSLAELVRWFEAVLASSRREC